MYNDRIRIWKGENVRFGRENLLIIIGTFLVLVLEADPPATAGGSASKTPHF